MKLGVGESKLIGFEEKKLSMNKTDKKRNVSGIWDCYVFTSLKVYLLLRLFEKY